MRSSAIRHIHKSVRFHQPTSALNYLAQVTGKTVFQLRHAKKIELRFTKDTDYALSALGYLENIEDVRLYETDVTDLGLACFKKVNWIKKLSIEWADKVTDKGFAFLQYLHDLQDLNIYQVDITDAAFAYLKNPQSLKRVHLAHIGLTDAGLIYFKGAENLGEFLLHEVAVTDKGLVYFKDHKKLHKVSLEWVELEGWGLAYLKSVRDLTLYFTGIDDDGLAYLPKSVQRLKAQEDKITDAGLVHLGEVKKLILEFADIRGKGLSGLKKVEELTLRETGTTDYGLPYFQGIPTLRILYLDHIRMTGSGAKHLIALRNVEKMYLHDLDISNRKIAELKEARPDCYIQYEAA